MTTSPPLYSEATLFTRVQSEEEKEMWDRLTEYLEDRDIKVRPYQSYQLVDGVSTITMHSNIYYIIINRLWIDLDALMTNTRKNLNQHNSANKILLQRVKTLSRTNEALTQNMDIFRKANDKLNKKNIRLGIKIHRLKNTVGLSGEEMKAILFDKTAVRRKVIPSPNLPPLTIPTLQPQTAREHTVPREPFTPRPHTSRSAGRPRRMAETIAIGTPRFNAILDIAK